MLLKLMLAQLICYVTSELTCEESGDRSGPCQWSCNLQGWSRGECSDQQCDCDGDNIEPDKLFKEKTVDSKDNLKVSKTIWYPFIYFVFWM